MSKTINFSNLKQEKVRKRIGDIEIYNITKENEKDVTDIIIQSLDEKTGMVKVDPSIVLVKLIPILTNIYLDLDTEKDEEMIKEIIADPSDVLLEVVDELNIIIKAHTDKLIKRVNEIATLSKEEQRELFDKIKPQESEEDRIARELKEAEAKEIEQLTKRLAELGVK